MVLTFAFSWAVPVAAGTEPLAPIPALSARVTDAVGLLSAEERQGLEQRLARIETEHGAQLAVLIVPTIAPESIEAYSLRVVEAWRLGRRGVDDGVLILVVVKERGLRIEVGRGLEGAIPDAVAKRLIAEVIAPRFAERDYVGGLTSGIERIGALIAGESLPAPARARRGDNTSTAENGGIESVLVVALMVAPAASAYLL
ncbi:MAG TPA: TPM domain-containing protein, partial [Rhodocyclaceae bacterium]|nr:TPM domain-containing protein [Rhodocyclaceae bacterium]